MAGLSTFCSKILFINWANKGKVRLRICTSYLRRGGGPEHDPNFLCLHPCLPYAPLFRYPCALFAFAYTREAKTDLPSFPPPLDTSVHCCYSCLLAYPFVPSDAPRAPGYSGIRHARRRASRFGASVSEGRSPPSHWQALKARGFRQWRPPGCSPRSCLSFRPAFSNLAFNFSCL